MAQSASRFLAPARTGLLGLTGVFLSAGPASAHVKWFCAFDVAGQPRGLENVLCPDFEELVGLALIVLTVAALVEETEFGASIQRALGSVLDPIRSNSELLIRAFVGFFFVALWTTGGIILTPELKTTSLFIPWLQLAIACGLLWRSTLKFSALGVLVLFATALYYYG